MAIDLFDETMGLLAELERHGVPYAVAGALALAIHGVLGRPGTGPGRHPALARARPVTPPEMSAHAVTSRLREASARSDLTASRRLLTKVDMSPAAVAMRPRVQSALRDACLAWARRRPASRT